MHGSCLFLPVLLAGGTRVSRDDAAFAALERTLGGAACQIPM